MTTKLSDQVRAFMTAFRQEMPATPTVPSEAIVRLRARLIIEECFELLDAVFTDSYAIENLKSATMSLADTADIHVAMPEMADALADIAYVVSGANLAFGIDGDTVLDVVQAANMAKTGGPVVNGKQLKPAGWVPPPIASILRKQGWVG